MFLFHVFMIQQQQQQREGQRKREEYQHKELQGGRIAIT